MIVLSLVLLIIGFIAIPELLFPLGTNATLIIIAFALVGWAWYFAFSRYQKGKGIDVGLTYKEIPPE